MQKLHRSRLLQSTPSSTAACIRSVTIGCTVLLAIVFGAGVLLTQPTAWRAMVSLVATAPLWLAIRGLSAGHRRTYAWMTLAVVPYLVVAMTESIASPAARLWAAACLFTTFTLFVLLIAYLRVTRPHAPAAADEVTDDHDSRTGRDERGG